MERELRTSRHQMEALSRRLIDVQGTERAHIARELHDQIGQALTAVKLKLQTIQRRSESPSISDSIAEGIATVDRAAEEVRSLALDLRPSALDDLGLVAALRWYTNRLGERAGIGVTFCADKLERRPPSNVETASFRVAQEALTNVVRHAKARSAVVELRRKGEHLELTVRDDGTGFDTVIAWGWWVWRSAHFWSGAASRSNLHRGKVPLFGLAFRLNPIVSCQRAAPSWLSAGAER